MKRSPPRSPVALLEERKKQGPGPGAYEVEFREELKVLD